ncbi:hypothetical protein [Streptomyces roseochromogenus]|uniref:Uncharacterized protein n=1 Tax=Streptomyces roseochromogenus subsp. oscitans DS 12.976 TaxID=1352936 RepID=V6JDY1_STRRC|nr:hypothetical protein [Streptomyces roseochromogenus]EST17933.1 hypothetical protein M878_46265 [Streptomyces roseochromogenus subsp. oscitans DS 12.976]
MGYDRHQRAAIRTAAATVAQQLAELTGTPPRIAAELDAIRIEADVTDAALQRWTRLLAVLELGTEYGVSSTPDGQIAWLRIELRRQGPRP